MAPTPRIRLATPQDAVRALCVYAPYVRGTAVSFEYDVPTVAEFSERIRAILERGDPFVVAEEGSAVVGYASLRPFVGREAYRHNAETTIYRHMGARGRGVGRALYRALEDEARARDILALEACIGVPREPDDPYLTDASVRFHSAMGYREVGRFEACGRKFDRWYDMVWMEKRLAEPF